MSSAWHGREYDGQRSFGYNSYRPTRSCDDRHSPRSTGNETPVGPRTLRESTDGERGEDAYRDAYRDAERGHRFYSYAERRPSVAARAPRWLRSPQLERGEAEAGVVRRPTRDEPEATPGAAGPAGTAGTAGTARTSAAAARDRVSLAHDEGHSQPHPPNPHSAAVEPHRQTPTARAATASTSHPPAAPTPPTAPTASTSARHLHDPHPPLQSCPLVADDAESPLDAAVDVNAPTEDEAEARQTSCGALPPETPAPGKNRVQDATDGHQPSLGGASTSSERPAMQLDTAADTVTVSAPLPRPSAKPASLHIDTELTSLADRPGAASVSTPRTPAPVATMAPPPPIDRPVPPLVASSSSTTNHATGSTASFDAPKTNGTERNPTSPSPLTPRRPARQSILGQAGPNGVAPADPDVVALMNYGHALVKKARLSPQYEVSKQRLEKIKRENATTGPSHESKKHYEDEHERLRSEMKRADDEQVKHAQAIVAALGSKDPRGDAGSHSAGSAASDSVIAALRDEVSKVLDQNEKLQRRVAKLEADNKSSDDNGGNADLGTRLDELSSNQNKDSKDIRDRCTRLATEVAKNTSALDATNRRLETIHAKWTDDTDHLHDQLVDHRRSSDEDFDRLSADLRLFRDDMKQFRLDAGQARALQSSVAQVTNKLDFALQDTVKTKDDLRKVMNNHLQVSQKLQALESTVKESLEKVEKLQTPQEPSESAPLVGQHQALSRQHDDLQGRVAKLETNPSWANNIDHVTARLQHFEQVLAKVEAKAGAGAGDHSAVSSAPSDAVKRQLQSIESAIDEVKSKHSGTETRLEAIEKGTHEYLRVMDGTTTELHKRDDALETRITEGNEAIEEVSKSVLTTQEYADSLYTKIEAYEKKWQSNLDDANKAISKSNEAFTKMETEQVRIQDSLRELRRDLNEVKAKMPLVPRVDTPAAQPQTGASGHASPSSVQSPVISTIAPTPQAQSRAVAGGWQHPQHPTTQLQQLAAKVDLIQHFVQLHENRMQTLTLKTVYDSMVSTMRQMYPLPDQVTRDISGIKQELSDMHVKYEEIASKSQDSALAQETKASMDKITEEFRVVRAQLGAVDRLSEQFEAFKSGIAANDNADSLSSVFTKIEDLKVDTKRDFEKLGTNMIQTRDFYDDKLKDIKDRMSDYEAARKTQFNKLRAIDERHSDTARDLHMAVEDIRDEQKRWNERFQTHVNDVGPMMDEFQTELTDLQSWREKVDGKVGGNTTKSASKASSKELETPQSATFRAASKPSSVASPSRAADSDSIRVASARPKRKYHQLSSDEEDASYGKRRGR